LAGSVGSDHATFHVRAPSAIFEVILDGHQVQVYVNELRFVITEEARAWLVAKNANLWKPQYQAQHVHNCNLDYALVGQTVLSQLLYLQVYSKGILIVKSVHNADVGASGRPVNELTALASELYALEISSTHYQKLRDLRERLTSDAGGSPLRAVTADRADRADVQSFGRRMDRFGIGRLKCYN
jgi:hypothetical protein